MYRWRQAYFQPGYWGQVRPKLKHALVIGHRHEAHICWCGTLKTKGFSQSFIHILWWQHGINCTKYFGFSLLFRREALQGNTRGAAFSASCDRLADERRNSRVSSVNDSDAIRESDEIQRPESRLSPGLWISLGYVAMRPKNERFSRAFSAQHHVTDDVYRSAKRNK